MSTPPDQAAREIATDISLSVIARAPAGSGKTTLLVGRFLNLLSAVDRPEEILAITFTRKAASEMRQRVLQQLKQGSDPLIQQIRKRDRDLGWNIADYPERLKIQTIDSFAAGLVKSMPLNSKLAPQSVVAQHTTPLYRQATSRLLTGAEDRSKERQYQLEISSEMLALLDNDYNKALRIISNMLGRRDQWIEPLKSTLLSSMSDTSELGIERLIGLAAQDLCQTIVNEFCAALPGDCAERLPELLAYSAENKAQAWPSEQVLPEPTDIQSWRYIGELLTTTTDTLRRKLNVKNGFPAGKGKAAEKKAQMMEILNLLAESHLESKAISLRFLPQASITAQEKTALKVLSLGLLNAAVELNGLFRELNEIDFSELTLSALNALESEGAPTELALALDYRIQHLLVDEFQDTSLSQFQLFGLLMKGWEPGDGRTFFGVGDPMQSIYRFRDADVGLFLKLNNESFASITLSEIQLKANFRSAPSLIEWYNRVFQQAFGTQEDVVLGAVPYSASIATQPVSDHSGVSVDLFPNSDGRAAEVREIINRVKKIREHTRDQSIAILVRSRSHLNELLPALDEAGLAWLGTDLDKLSNEPVVQDLYALLQCLMDPLNRISWFAFLRSPLVGLKLADLELLAGPEEAVYENIRLNLALTSLSLDARTRLERLLPVIDSALKLRAALMPRQWLEHIWIQLGGYDAWSDERSVKSAERFLQLLSHQTQQRIDLDQLEVELDALFAAPGSPCSDPVDIQVMTIHKAKGLEFDHVLLPGLDRTNRASEAPLLLWRPQNKGLLMATRDDRSPGSLYHWLSREERERDQNERIRLIYVAATRAVISLSLFACVEAVDEGFKAPPKQSLLAPIWPAISDEAHFHGLHPEQESNQKQRILQDSRSVQDTAPQTQREAQTRSMPARLRRLATNYRWRPPVDIPDLTLGTVSEVSEVSQAQLSEDSLETCIGSLLHRALYRLSRAKPEHWQSIVAQPAYWREKMQPLKLSNQVVEESIDQMQQQLESLISDKTAIWILDQNHHQAASEKGYVGLIEGEVLHVVVDRTFVDDNGVRWIIDYKTGQKPSQESEENFFLRHAEYHKDQLERYARILLQFDGRPQRLALYFTALNKLHVL